MLIFLVVSSFSYGANVYFVVVNNGDVYDGAVYYSQCELGAAAMGYTIAHVSNYFVSVENYGARIKYPDGYWGPWQNARQGGWVLKEAGTYKIQGRVKVIMDRRGEGNYWMYSDILTFYVVDTCAPSIPQSINSTSSNNHPKIVWDANTQRDMLHYKVYKRKDSPSYNYLATTTNPYYVDETETIYYTWNGAIKTYAHYKVKAFDINTNESDYSEDTQIAVEGSNQASKIVSDNSSSTKIESYELFANYPNPFNPSTQISYQIPKNSFVNLIVYNALGQEVAQLVNQHQSSGKYSVKFNAANLPSGVYIYKLVADSYGQVGSFSSTKKMLLTK